MGLAADIAATMMLHRTFVKKQWKSTFLTKNVDGLERILKKWVVKIQPGSGYGLGK